MKRLLRPCGFVIAAIATVLALGVPGAGASNPAEYGLKTLSASLSTTQAGAHPDFTTVIELKTDPSEPTGAGYKPPYARTKDLSITVPPGLLGNPNNFPQCTTQQLEEFEKVGCPQDSQVGVTVISLYNIGLFTEPVFMMTPEEPRTVARIGFVASSIPTILNLHVLPEQGYGIEAKLENASPTARLVRAETTLWGVPTDSSHDSLRLTAKEAKDGELPPGGSRKTGLAPRAFMTNPTRCGPAGEIRAEADSYQLPGRFSTLSTTLPAITGCGKLTFPPVFSLAPTSTEADSPSGVDATLSLPQEGLRDPRVLATPHLKKAVVELPQGMTLNPASANGLGACSEAQMGLISADPIRFDSSPASCPPSSKVGTAEIETPVLPGPVEGSLYLATQTQNPFGSLLAGYLVAEGHGVVIKLAGRFDVDPASGRITAVFDENPEQPFERLRLHFKSGNQGVLTTPGACGQYAIAASLTPWSASEVVNSLSPFSIDRGPGGGGCPNGSFSASLSAGTVNPTGGAFSPFVLQLSRADGTPRLHSLELSLPPGLTGKLAGIPYCSDQALGLAASANHPGEGALQAAAPSCPAASQLGSVSVGVGSGPSPFFVSTGRVYLAGPYKGAPLSFAVLAPALAGPFDLGNVVVRTALRVDPASARITAVSDPLPTILDGIPLDLRDLRVNIDRSGFTLNPTSCKPKSFSGSVTSEGGAVAPISERFQAASCASLGFGPKLSIRFKGALKRTGHPALRAVLKTRAGDANVARAVVTLPHGEFIDQAHISSPCTRVQFNADQCPKKSILGKARVFTPLLDRPLEGPVIFRSNGGERLLPDIVLDLHGQIDLLQVGFVDSKKGRLRTTFASTPDAPFSKLVLSLKGGKEGLLQNSENLCEAPRRAKVKLAAQNGRAKNFTSKIAMACDKHGKGGRRGKAGR
jgi:hypothetical protein